MASGKGGTFRYDPVGGAHQLRIRTADDLAAVLALQEPFWMATSAPVDQLACDAALMKRLDKDQNGRVLSWEIREAAGWLLRVLRDRAGITAGSDTLELAAIDTGHDTGLQLHETARRILSNLGKGDSAALTLAEVRDRQAIFAQGIHNGDGVIPPDNVPDEELGAFIRDIMATVGTVEDLSGAAGVNGELAQTFMDEARALLAWHQQLEEQGESLFPLGDGTAAGHALYAELAPVIEGYFLQCRVAALNERLGRATPDVPCPADALTDDAEAEAYLAESPPARPRPEPVLPLDQDLNPCYADRLATLAQMVLSPILGGGFDGRALTETQWDAVKQVLAPYASWCASKSGARVEGLGLERLRAYRDGDHKARLDALIAADVAAGNELEALADLEYAILLQRWFLEICNNFVSFAHLYDQDKHALFEAGRIVMDGHVFRINFRVADVNAHSAMAEQSGAYLLYSEVTRAGDDRPFFVVTPVTTGRIANLAPGKRGVLFDFSGKEWDTRVVKIVANPVNLWQALVAPFKRIGTQISSTAERITAGAEKQVQAQVTQATSSLETSVQEGIAVPGAADSPGAEAGAPAPPPTGGNTRDLVMAGSVAVAALGSSFAFMAKQLSNLGDKWEYVVAAVVVGLSVILVPTFLVAFFKLRKRNIGAILEASGWALNAPMRLTRGVRRLIIQRPWRPGEY